MSDSLPRLVDAAYTVFECRVFGCTRCVAWMDCAPVVGLGFCDEHKTRATTIPISVYGRQREGWNEWPGSLVAYLYRSSKSNRACCARSDMNFSRCADSSSASASTSARADISK